MPIDYTRRYTLEEYLAMEERSELKHEFWDGYIVPKHGYDVDDLTMMAGASQRHNQITINTLFSLRQRLRGSGCRALGQDMSLRFAGERAYPDVMVSCHAADLKATLHWQHPTLIIEVLSNSTQARDREWKLDQYRRLPSLQQYVLVSQYRVWVESFDRQPDGSWTVQTFSDLTDEVPVPALSLRLPLSELYEEVELGPLRVV